jgi:hypothetical protein
MTTGNTRRRLTSGQDMVDRKGDLADHRMHNAAMFSV